MNHVLSFVSASLVFHKKYNHIKQRKWKFFCKVVSDKNEVIFLIKTCQIREKSSSSTSPYIKYVIQEPVSAEKQFRHKSGIPISPHISISTGSLHITFTASLSTSYENIKISNNSSSSSSSTTTTTITIWRLVMNIKETATEYLLIMGQTIFSKKTRNINCISSII